MPSGHPSEPQFGLAEELREIEVSELPQTRLGGGIVSPRCSFRRRETAEVYRPIVDCDPRHPAIPQGANAFEAMAGSPRPVGAVLGSRRLPKVFRPIIAFVAIDVVDISHRPSIMDHGKHYPVRKVEAPADCATSIPLSLRAGQRFSAGPLRIPVGATVLSGPSTIGEIGCRPRLPEEPAGPGVKVQELPQFRWRHKSRFSHVRTSRVLSWLGHRRRSRARRCPPNISENWMVCQHVA